MRNVRFINAEASDVIWTNDDGSIGSGNVRHPAVVAWGGVPVPFEPKPVFDPLIEVVTGPNYTEGAPSVWTKRNKTAPEIDADKDAATGAVNGMYSPLLKILRNHENRLRLLENAQFATSKPPLSLADVKAALKELL